ALPRRALSVARVLMSPGMFSGWGVRTLHKSEPRYDPMSYHNGSVWPHDNAIIASGLARYGFKAAATRLFKAFLDASTFLELHRLPELYCGFKRRLGKGPTQYPVACSPQAWAAGAAFMLLRACLGMTIDAPSARIVVKRPQLPDPLRHV